MNTRTSVPVAGAITPTQRSQVIEAVRVVLERGGSQLDPTAPVATRAPAFARIVRPAIERGEISGITSTDDATLRTLYDATIGWGVQTQALLDDLTVTEVKIIGTTVTAATAQGTVTIPDAYGSTAEPIARVQALAQMLGITWDAVHASVTLPLPNKTRLHATRAPLLPEGDVLIVIRRGRTRAWTPDDLVARGALDAPTAQLLTTLVQSGVSVLVAGPQDAGKTTALECLLNVLPLSTHLVLVEDATDEFALRSRSVTRLQVGSQAADAFGVVVRETLRMTPDVLVPCEIRGAEAGAVLQIAEAGRPTLTTIHADTPQAAIDRFARLAASDVPGNSFAGREAAATRTVASAFHMVVQMQRVARIGQRVVQQVALLDGLDTHGRPQLRPLVTARIDGRAPGGVVWEAHASIAGDALVWRDGSTTPAPVAMRLQAYCAAAALSRPLPTTTHAQLGALLARAATLIDDGGDATAPLQALTDAWQIDPRCGTVYDLLDRIVQQEPQIASDVARLVAQSVVRLQDALDAGDLVAAVEIEALPQGSLLLSTALARDLAWSAQVARAATLRTLADTVLRAIQQAHQRVAQAGDLTGALALLQGFDQQQLPHAIRARLLDTRLDLLEWQLPTVSAAERPLLQHRITLTRQARHGNASVDAQLPGGAHVFADQVRAPLITPSMHTPTDDAVRS